MRRNRPLLGDARREAHCRQSGPRPRLVEEGEAIPKPTDLDAIPRDHEIAEAARILVRGELPGKLERVNITVDEGLLKVIDRAAEARGMTRSGFLAEGARQLLLQRDAKTDRIVRARRPVGVTTRR